MTRALFRSFQNDCDFLKNFIGTQGSEQTVPQQLRRGRWGAGVATLLICGPAALRSMRRARSAHDPRERGGGARTAPPRPTPVRARRGEERCSAFLVRPRELRVQWGDQRPAGPPRPWILVKRNWPRKVRIRFAYTGLNLRSTQRTCPALDTHHIFLPGWNPKKGNEQKRRAKSRTHSKSARCDWIK